MRRVAKVFSIVCDECGSARDVERYELRTPKGKFSLDLCGKHGREWVAKATKLAGEPQQGKQTRKVYPLDAGGNPIVD